MTGFLLILLLSSRARASDYPMPPEPPGRHLNFTSDSFDYEDSSSIIHLKGKVRIVESTWTVKADELWLDVNGGVGRSTGYILLEDGVSAVYGDSGEVDYQNHIGYLEHPRAGHGDWSLRAGSARLEEKGRLVYRQADFTSCSAEPSHYHFRSSRVTVVPRKYILAYNTLFYLGPVPVFYTPVLFKSLKKNKYLRFKLQPGYDRRNGGFVKSTLVTPHGPFRYSKLYLDYYGAQGFGAGGELHQRKSEDSRGVLYGYRIRENLSTHRERWAVLGDQYQGLISSVALQGRLQVQSDTDFNNDYARSSTFRVTPELINSAAVVYRHPKVTARLSYSRIDVDDGGRARFIKSKESSPRLDAQTSSLQWGRLPWLNTLTGFADNSFRRGRGFQERSVGAAWEATRTLVLARGISVTPRGGYRQTYFNRVDTITSFISTDTARDAFIGHYLLEGNLRVGTLAGDWDLTHTYDRRQRINSMADDAGALDRGVETHLTNLQNAYRPNRRVLLRVSSGYDHRVFRDRSVIYRNRVQPIVGEINYAPRSALNFSLRDDYHLKDGNRSFLLNGQWGEIEDNFISGGVSHNLATPRSYLVNTEFGWSSRKKSRGKPGWRVAAALRSEVISQGGFGRIKSLRLFEKEITLAKAFHDFNTRAMARFRPGGVREAFFRVDMRVGSFDRDEVTKRDWEAEWFPERKGFEERP